MKTAIVHDWIYSISGAEKVLEAIYELFPSKVYTLIHNTSQSQGLLIPKKEVITSFIQKLPLAQKIYPYYLPLFPWAIENIDVSHEDVVISSSSSVAKGVLTHVDQLHICYCHTPMRYIWDLYFQYLEEHSLSKGARSILAKALFRKLRIWDLSHRVDHFIANSRHVAKRILKIYGKESTVIYPPVDWEYFKEGTFKDEGFYLTVSRLVPYKKVKEIVRAFSYMKEKRLIVIGGGPELKELKKIATSNIEFLGHTSRQEMRSIMYRAKAFVYMAHEDFGIAPVEAQSAGLPIIAYGKGGVLETVIAGSTGLFFPEQTRASLIQTIEEFEKIEHSFDKTFIQNHARQFSKSVFLDSFKKHVQTLYDQFKAEL